MMTTGSVPGKPGFSNKSNPKGPTAGFDYQINPAFDGIDDGVLNMEK